MEPLSRLFCPRFRTLAAIASRWSISAVFALWVVGPNAQAQNAVTAINGVYNGTYTCAQGPRTLRLSLLASGNGSLTGVFTFYLPPTSHTQAFSYSLSGTFDAASRKFKLNPVKWEGSPPAGYSMVGMDGAFDPGARQVAGKITYGNCGAFQATRDQAGSANLNSIIAPQASAAGTQATRQTNAQPATPRGQPSATSMTGVYIGTYTCNGGPSKLKVSLIGAPDDTLAGFFIVDLPHDGPRFTYKLTGRYAWGTHQFLLTSVPWGPEPPAEYTMSRLAGKYNPGSDLLRGYVTSVSCSDFWGERDKSESPETIAMAMQKEPPPNPPRPQSLPAPAREAKAAAPLPTATKGIVHESKAYWGAYRSDIIRQVFEGDFGRHVDSSTQFRILFNSYVESFSKSCHSYLPAQHEAVTLSQVTTKKDSHGNVISQQGGQSWTVDVDSRFVPEYREYAASLGSTSGETLAGAVSVMSGRVSASAYFDPGTDIDKFFETETCQSAAMRQLTENLLRAAKGRDPLQDAGDPNIVRVCVPANLVENHSWNNPPPGGKMEAFKNAVRKTVRDEARSKSLENPLFWVVERPANGSADLFDTFDPATTDAHRLVVVGGAGRGAHCSVGSYALTLPINP